MNEVFPVLIPSKGRSDSCPTAELLGESSVPFRLAVEPQDVDAYMARWPRSSLLILDDDDRGLPHSRNFILDWSRRQGFDWFWMLDDDIRGFYRVEDRRCVKAPARDVLAAAQAEFADDPSLAQAALEYQQFAWSAKSNAKNGYCDVAVCIHAKRIGRHRYRAEADVKEDRDFTLQLLASGWDTMRATRYAFAAPKNGSNAGGLHEVYAQPGREAAASRRMVEMWGPEICTAVTKADGRQDVKIRWAHFRR